MRRSLSILSASLLLLAASAAIAAPTSTVVTLKPGDNVVNFTVTPVPTTPIQIASSPRIAAPRATCSAYRAINPTSALTVAVCKQAALAQPTR